RGPGRSPGSPAGRERRSCGCGSRRRARSRRGVGRPGRRTTSPAPRAGGAPRPARPRRRRGGGPACAASCREGPGRRGRRRGRGRRRRRSRGRKRGGWRRRTWRGEVEAPQAKPRAGRRRCTLTPPALPSCRCLRPPPSPTTSPTRPPRGAAPRPPPSATTARARGAAPPPSSSPSHPPPSRPPVLSLPSSAVFAHNKPGLRLAWCGPSLLALGNDGTCRGRSVSGFFFREARFLSRFGLEIEGEAPVCCSVASVEPHALEFTYVYPPVEKAGGGGSGSGMSGRKHGLLFRTLDFVLRLTAHPAHVEARL